VIDLRDRSFEKGPLGARIKNIGLRPHGYVEGLQGAPPYDIYGECEERTLGSWRIGISLGTDRSSINLLQPELDLARIEEWLPENARKEWRRFSPAGSCGLLLSLQLGPADEGPPKVSANANLHDCSVDYELFPYEVSMVTGNIELGREGVVFQDLRGSTDPGALSLQGTVSGFERNKPEFYLHIKAEDLPLDGKLRNALQPEVQKVWDEVNVISGKSDLSFDIGGVVGEPPQFGCEALIRDGEVQYSKFPLTVEKIGGRVSFSNELFQARDLKGNVAGAEASEINANVSIQTPEGSLSLEADITAEKLPATEELAQCLPAQVSDVWDELRPMGTLSGEFHFAVSPEADEPKMRAEVDFSELSISPARFPYRFAGVHSIASYDGRELTFTQVPAKPKKAPRPPGALVIEGKISGLADVPTYDLRVAADGLPMDDRLYSALPPAAKEIWLKARPSGTIDAAAALSGKVGDQVASIPLQIALHDCAMNPGGFKITNGEGAFSFEEGRVEVTSFEANFGPIPFSVNGLLRQEAGQWGGDFRFGTQPFEVSQSLIEAIPQTYAANVNDILRSGELALDGSIRSRKGSHQFEAAVRLKELSLREQMSLSDLSGELVLVGDVKEEGVDIAGRASLDSARVAWLRLSDLETLVHWDDAGFALRELQANAYGGRLEADLETDSAEGELKAHFRLASAKLERFVGQTAVAGQRTKGKVDIDANIAAHLKEKTISGTGEARIEDGYLWEIPLFTALLKILPFNLGELTTFSKGKVAFALGTDHVRLAGLELLSTVLAIDGEGTVGYDTSMDLELGIRPTSKSILPIPLVDQLFKIVGALPKKVIPFRVKGTFAEPDVSIDVAAAPIELIKALFDILPLPKKERQRD